MNSIKNVVSEQHYLNYEDLVHRISESIKKFKTRVYRGQGSDQWDLIPSAFRPWNGVCKTEKLQVMAELDRCQSFFEEMCASGFPPFVDHNEIREYFGSVGVSKGKLVKWIPEKLYELNMLMQHYGKPTSMLDWTRNMFIALFFSAASAIIQGNNIIHGNDKIKGRELTDEDRMALFVLNEFELSKLAKQYNLPMKLVMSEYPGNKRAIAQEGGLSWEERHFPFGDEEFNPISLDVRILNYANENEIQLRNPLLHKCTISYDQAPSIIKILGANGYSPEKMYPDDEGKRWQEQLDKNVETFEQGPK